MTTLRMALLFVAGFYGGLMLLGGVSQLKNKQLPKAVNIGMILGGLMVVAVPSVFIEPQFLSIAQLIVGLLIIHVCALANGKLLHGHINISHHLVRLLISIAIITLYIKA